MGKLTAAIIVTVMAGAAAPAAFAQTPAQPPGQWFIGAGGGLMNPVHGDDEDEGRVALVTFGFTDNRRVRVEGELTRRSHRTSYVDTDVFLYGGTTGIHGHADRTERVRHTTDWTVGVNLIGRTGGRRLSLWGGPGAVFHREDLHHYRTVTNCTPPIPSSGGECREFDERTSEHGGGLQLMAGVDLVLHSRVSAFAAGRAEYRRGLAMGGVGAVAGLRIAIQ
jgi:opacity protein-like surface antigen